MTTVRYLEAASGGKIDSTYPGAPKFLDVEGNRYRHLGIIDGAERFAPDDAGDWIALVTYCGPNAPQRPRVLPVGTRVRNGSAWKGRPFMGEVVDHSLDGAPICDTTMGRWVFVNLDTLEVVALPDTAPAVVDPPLPKPMPTRDQVSDAVRGALMNAPGSRDAKAIKTRVRDALGSVGAPLDVVASLEVVVCGAEARVAFSMNGIVWGEYRQHETKAPEPKPTGYDGDDKPLTKPYGEGFSRGDVAGRQKAMAGSLPEPQSVASLREYTPPGKRRAGYASVRIDTSVWDDFGDA